MTGYGGKELAAAFRTVRKNTIQIAEDIPADKYDVIAAPGARSVASMLAHIIVAPGLYEDMHRVKQVTTLEGYDFPGVIARGAAEEKKLTSKALILPALKSEGERFAAWLESLSTEFLSETYLDHTKSARTRFESLLSPKEHEMHHRAQLMLIERMLGIVPHLTKQLEERRAARAAAAAVPAKR